MKLLLALLNNPLFVFLNSLMGATAIAYLQNTATQTFLWFVPCFFIILADLVAGVRASKFRGEEVKISTALRRTGNKVLCYFSWVVCCVALNERYSTEKCAWVGMGIVFLVEAISFISNILEPHGIQLSVKGILKIVGKKTNHEGLEEIIKDK